MEYSIRFWAKEVLGPAWHKRKQLQLERLKFLLPPRRSIELRPGKLFASIKFSIKVAWQALKSLHIAWNSRASDSLSWWLRKCIRKVYNSFIVFLDPRYIVLAFNYQRKIEVWGGWPERWILPTAMQRNMRSSVFSRTLVTAIGAAGHLGGYYWTSDHLPRFFCSNRWDRSEVKVTLTKCPPIEWRFHPITMLQQTKTGKTPPISSKSFITRTSRYYGSKNIKLFFRRDEERYREQEHHESDGISLAINQEYLPQRRGNYFYSAPSIYVWVRPTVLYYPIYFTHS